MRAFRLRRGFGGRAPRRDPQGSEGLDGAQGAKGSVKKAVEEVSRYRVTLFALVVQFLAVVTQPIVVRTRTALVLGNVLTRTTCAVVMMHAICGWLLVLIDGIERCCLGHWECSFLSSRDDISILRAALGWGRKRRPRSLISSSWPARDRTRWASGLSSGSWDRAGLCRPARRASRTDERRRESFRAICQ